MQGLKYSNTGRHYGHSTMALSKSGPYLPRNPDAGGPVAISLGTPSQHSHGNPMSAGGREDASEGMTIPQTLDDFEAMKRRRAVQTANLDRGMNAFSSGDISDYYRQSNPDVD